VTYIAVKPLHLDIWVQLSYGARGDFGLSLAAIALAEKHATAQVAGLYRIKVDDEQAANSHQRKAFEDFVAERARAYDHHRRGSHTRLLPPRDEPEVAVAVSHGVGYDNYVICVFEIHWA
jgi:hypothetical protein